MNSDIKILGITLTYNEEKMIPYVMPYYERMKIDKLIVYDNYSTDNTVAMLQSYPFVEVRKFQSDGMNEQIHINIKNEVWKAYKNDYDWCICSDFDEVIYCQTDFKDMLAKKMADGKTVFRQTMLNLYGYNAPSYNTLVHEEIVNGCLWKDFDTNINWGMKTLLFNIKEVESTNYTWGCHNDNFVGNIVLFNDDFYSFHLKYIDFNETLKRNIIKTNRQSSFNIENHLTVDDQITDKEKLKNFYELMESHSIPVINFITQHSSIQQYHFFNANYGINKYFNKDMSDKDKFLVCACAKNENKYVVEWVQHYLNYGFDKIIICDNNDDDSIENILKEYIDRGVVEIFDCRGLSSFQVQFYSYFAEEGNYKWCAYFDIDEFLELPAYKNIKEYLSTKEDDCISFNWLIYGSNGKIHYEDCPVQERFSLPFLPINMAKENCFVKSILRGGTRRFKNCVFNGSHIPTCDNQKELKYSVGGYFYPDYVLHEHLPPRYKEGYVKHYCTKSFDEWVLKAGRGWPDGTNNLTIGNYFVTSENFEIPLNKYYEGFFVYTTIEDLYKAHKDILDAYEILQIYNTSHCIYTLIVVLSSFFKKVKGHTFILTIEHLDDTTYNLLFELAIRTGNNVVFSKDDKDCINTIFYKYSTGKTNCYYIIDV